MNTTSYRLALPSTKKVPLVVSVPHAGTQFPEELLDDFLSHVIQHPEDTDWFVDQLYQFAPRLGITLIAANYSRYVIDLNRSPYNYPLYPHQGLQTSLTPTQSFNGTNLYRQSPLCPNEIQRRIKEYYIPYHECISQLLEDLTSDFGHVLFFDAHSIKHRVPSLRQKPFLDLTLSDNNGKCSHPQLAQSALRRLQNSPYTVGYNSFFLGGQLVRSMGQPHKKHYGLQLEISQNIYMDENTTKYLPNKAHQLQNLLQSLLIDLIQTMESLI